MNIFQWIASWFKPKPKCEWYTLEYHDGVWVDHNENVTGYVGYSIEYCELTHRVRLVKYGSNPEYHGLYFKHMLPRLQMWERVLLSNSREVVMDYIKSIEPINANKSGKKKPPSLKPLDDMSMSELRELIDRYLDESNFEKVQEIQKIIDRKLENG